MPKKILTLLLAALLTFSLCACGLFAKIGKRAVKDDTAHVELMAEVDALIEAAARQYDAGLTFRSEYLYGLAQAEISSLRLCIDYVLWLKGEGANLAEVIGDAPYRTWDEIIGAGPGSSVPFYFEGLLYKFQGETEKSEACFAQAGYNKLYEKRDFYYLRRLSVDELYSLKKDVAAQEDRVYRLYTPRTALLAERTGAEFLPAYHLAMANERASDTDAAAQCALNALLTDPLTPSLYANAAAYELSAGNVDLAIEILNEGLFLAPEDESVNDVAKLFTDAAGDNAPAASLLSVVNLSAGTMSLQEQSWLSHLRPTNLPKPKGRDSYPVELLVSIPSQKQIKLTGTCAFEGGLTDEDLLAAIKKAATSAGYKSPENAVTDKLRIDELKNKLTFGEEEKNRIIKNWLSLVGMDKVADMLKGKLPTYGETDAVGIVIDMITSGELPDETAIVPIPPNLESLAKGLVINGTFITYEQYKLDQEKFRNIVELSNARARFREFRAQLDLLIKEQTRKNTAWTIRIQDQVVEEQLYRGSPKINVPYIYTADIVLTKVGGEHSDPVGTYQGDFKLDIDLSLEDYDKNFHRYLADALNERLKATIPHISSDQLWKPISQTANRTSENKATLEGKNVYVTLSDGLGGVFELKLNTMALDVTYIKVVHDFVSVLQKKSEGATETLTWTEITDSETGTSYQQDHTVVVDASGKTTETTNTADDPYPNIDPRTYLSLTLVADLME